MADFGALARDIKEWQETAAWLTLLDPRTGDPIGDPPARILLTSPLSERWVQMDKAYYSQVRLRRQADPEARFTPEDVEQFEAHRVKCYMAVTRDWEHIDRDGAPLACVPVNLEWLYNLPWVAGQLLEFMSDLKNFGAPVGTENGHMPDLIGDAEKKSLTGVSGSLQ